MSAKDDIVKIDEQIRGEMRRFNDWFNDCCFPGSHREAAWEAWAEASGLRRKHTMYDIAEVDVDGTKPDTNPR